MDDILKALDTDNHSDSFLRLNKQSIAETKDEILSQVFGNEPEKLEKAHKSLKEYRYINDLSDLRYGGFIRWVNLKKGDNLKLALGGSLLDIIFDQNNTKLMVKSMTNNFFKLVFDNCVVFQRLTDQEIMLLELVDLLNE